LPVNACHSGFVASRSPDSRRWLPFFAWHEKESSKFDAVSDGSHYFRQ
jgi:hypothetical protein